MHAAQVADLSKRTEGLVPVEPEVLLARPLMVIAETPGVVGSIGHVSLQHAQFDGYGESWQQLSTLAVFPGFTGNGLARRLVEIATSMAHRQGNHVYAYGNPGSRSAFDSFGYSEELIFDRMGLVKRCAFIVSEQFQIA